MYATIHTIAPFDSSVGANINFTWSGNQIYKVRCIIKNNTTGITVYDNTIDTMKQVYPLPSDSGLINGTKYIAYITVYDVDNNESTIQNIGTPFYCFTTPTFNLSVSNGDIIRASSYSIGLTYSQVESELLNWFNIALYSYQRTLVDSSGQIYDTTDLSYIVSNLQNATQYYIRATGETINGMSLDTGYILVTVSYTTAQIFSKLELNNISETGAIEIKTHIISAEGVPEKEVIYIDGEQADLQDNSVMFDEGYEVDGDFTKIFKFSRPKRNKVIIEFGTTDKLNIKIYYRQGSYSDSNGEKGYFELVANSCGINYISNSNYVDILAGDYYYEYSLLVNRKNGLFDLKAIAKGTLVRYSPTSTGSNMTESRQPTSQYVGVGYMPREVYENENLLGRSQKFGIDLTRMDGWLNYQDAYTIIPDSENPDFNVATCSATGLVNNAIRSLYSQYVPITYGDILTATISFKVSSWDVSRPCILELYRNDKVRIGYRDIEYNSSSVTLSKPFVYNEWIEAYIKIDTTNSGLFSFNAGSDWNNVVYFGLRLTLFKNGEIFFKKVKLECGDTATPWTPAPSDWLSDPSNYEWIPIGE
ncbi:hypothetical protein [Lacrimispora indolis]|uniref:hypothetical protein n=1 Tax=Lacrimispora indolis TaxID=69825 RepID=UPI00040AF7AF|nr:hypothetical protein [[Clostridium] methoxybenzovorans]